MKKIKFYNHFSLLYKAFASTHREAFASVVILLILTIIFTFVLWLAEKDFSLFESLAWVVVKFVDDPAEVASSPVTIFGQVIGTMVGVLGVAIFAVPAGLIGSGLLDAMAEEKEKEKTEKNSALLHKRFRRIAQAPSYFTNEKGLKVTLKGVPRFRSFPHITMKTGMTNEDIIAAVNNCPDMRLMNTATTQSSEVASGDELVVVNFPLNNEYGCCLDRGSDVTIVAPAAVTELGTGNFAFSLAAMGGFNYVSKELTPNPDDPFGFYSMQKDKLKLIGEYDVKEDVESQALHFMDDLKTLKERSEKAGRNHWFIFLMGTSKSAQCQVHLWRLATDNANKLADQVKNGIRYGSTVKPEDEERLQQIYSVIQSSLCVHNVVINGESKPITVDLDNNSVLKSVRPSNIMCRMGGGVSCNTLTLRICYEILVYSSQHLIIAKNIADAIKGVIEPEREITQETKKCYLKEGDGFADDFCQSVVFETDPEALREMLKQKNEEAREKFEHLDLDGNEEKAPERDIFGRIKK